MNVRCYSVSPEIPNFLKVLGKLMFCATGEPKSLSFKAVAGTYSQGEVEVESVSFSFLDF